MTNSDKQPQEAMYTSSNGRVRVYYRTVPNADDELQRALIVGRYEAEEGEETHRAYVRVKTISEFSLATFCTRLELLDEAGAVLETHPFKMALLKTLTGPYAVDGWPAQCALLIYREVLDRTARRVEEVKKESGSASAPSTPASDQPAAPAKPSPTSS